MKVVVDRELCEGNARCVQLAPEVFLVGDDDQVRVTSVIDPALREKIEAAVAVCPRQALSIVED